MSDALFPYGTLQFPEVMEAVTGVALPWVKAEAQGFAQFRFKDRIYPGMVAREGALTQGRVYSSMSHQIWELLDRFEDPVYRRELLGVHCSDGSKITAHAYVLPVAQQHLLSSELWQMDWFSDVHLVGYVSRCRTFHEPLTSQGLPESCKQTVWKVTNSSENSQAC